MLLKEIDKSTDSKLNLYLLIIVFCVFCFLNVAEAGVYGVDPIKNPEDCNVTKRWVTEDSDSTLFDPKIVAHQDIAIACVGYKDSVKLGSSGECAYIGLDRFCARIAEEETNGNNYACPSCQRNSSGEPITSGECPNCRCNCDQRVCAYHDIQGSDVPGYDTHEPEGTSDDDYRYCCIQPPVGSRFMPYHKDSLNPCCGKENSSCSLWGYDPCGQAGVSDGKYINTNADHIGCVDIPLGPYPPPLCDPIQGVTPTVSSFNICQYSPDYELKNLSSSDDSDSKNYKQVSEPCEDDGNTCDSICEYSTTAGKPTDPIVYNSFEKPLVRLYFENLLKLCPSNYIVPDPAPSNDNCVQFFPDSSFTPESIWKNSKNLIPGCAPDSVESKPANCISFPSGQRDAYHNGPAGSSNVSGFDSYIYFKPYYHVYNADSINEEDAKPYADYATKYPGATTSVGGVYDTYYADMTDGSNVEIVDFMSLTRKFNSHLNIDDGDGTELCIDEDVDGKAVPVGCFDRPKMFPPIVHECTNSSSCNYSSGTTLHENPRIAFDVGTDVVKRGIIGMDLPKDGIPAPFCVSDDNVSSGNSKDNPAECTVHKAKIFSAYLTDDVNYMINYDTDEDGASGPDNIGTVTPYKSGETYTGGIQFVNYVYCRGATKICLLGYDNPNKTVIAKIVNGAISNTLTDRVIPPYTAGQTTLTDEQLYDPEENVWISSASGSATSVLFGYKVENDNGTYSYYEYPGCTSGAGEGEIWCTVDEGVTTYPTEDITCQCTNSIETYPCNNDLCTVAFQQTTTTTNDTMEGYQYTDSTGTTHKYSIDEYGERAVNAMELGQCVEAAQPYCGAITGQTSSSSTALSNGYANWPQTNINNIATGTCVSGMIPKQDIDGNDILPTRICEYVDTNSGGGVACPTSTIAFGKVSNDCVKSPYPPWWPSEFLQGIAKYQGAIFNEFNLAFYYKNKITPGCNNYHPYHNESVSSSNSSTWIEDWYTLTTYDSCKRYGSSVTTGNTKRTCTDGDQEMLFLTAEQWRSLWNSSKHDLTWLLGSGSSRNGCYVYDLEGNVNLTVNSSYASDIKIGMKICKYNSKVSFSLVDLTPTSSTKVTDYSNHAYIMQSNIAAYDHYTSQYSANVRGDFYPRTVITNDLEDRKGDSTTDSRYHYYINHGIIVNTEGFGAYDYGDLEVSDPPADFVSNETEEKVDTELLWVGDYQYDTSKGNYWIFTFKTTNNAMQCPGGDDNNYGSYDDKVYALDLDDGNSISTALLDFYRSDINYSGVNDNDRINIGQYLPPPLNISPSYNNSSGKNDSYISKLYTHTCYNGGNKDGPWPYENYCRTEIHFKTYTAGNSARNANMFYWASPDDYRPGH